MISIYTDGACSGNPGKGGWAIVKVNNKTDLLYKDSGFKEYTTNNEMELTAFLKGLQLIEDMINKNKQLIDEIFHICTDSAYVYNCFDQFWYEYWQTHNWTTKSKTKVKNVELWKEVIPLYEKLCGQITLVIDKVKGHSTNKYNNMADELAVDAYKGI